jgi:hypothetical protein
MINQKAEIAQKRKENETDTEKGKNCWKTKITFVDTNQYFNAVYWFQHCRKTDIHYSIRRFFLA